ncbi:hypothetical protein MSHI_20020 [Mycobacterium shinjukuense]|uniref:Uncharacterized protein n=1 Tax=Mycobacterium shinjukuense TaxID=398694 RepID=A0A7I7MPT6_9MYCO|nr:hypothetical protein MSHI_20020 [Mycobacterium shinjukuense]
MSARTSRSWKAAACALRDWYFWAYDPNKAVTAADTSSAAGASTAVVDNAAAALAALIIDPIPANSEAAVVIKSGTANINDICDLPRGAIQSSAAKRTRGTKSYPRSECLEGNFGNRVSLSDAAGKSQG